MLKMPEKKTLKLRDIKPYQGNPRRITAKAVDAVKESIERYGYQQPIVVDKDNVIVVGHTRFQAMQELGMKEIEVYVTDLPPEQVREYRLIDNKTSEMGEWDHSALVVELREFEEQLLENYFPEIDLEVTQIKDVLITNEDVERALSKIAEVKEAKFVPTTQVVCPSCFHTFEVKTSSLPGMSHDDIDGMTSGGSK